MRTSITMMAAATLLTSVLAKTDLAGCTSSAGIVSGAYTALYWVPETGEICEGLDCGGGRSKVKTDVPGCDAYEGNLEYEPSYISGWGADGKSAAAATTSAKAVVASSSAAAPAPAVTSKASASISAVPVVTLGSDVAVSTAKSNEAEGMMSIQTETKLTTSAPSFPSATGTGMVASTSEVATSIVLDGGNSTSSLNSGAHSGSASNGTTAPQTDAGSQAAVGLTFMGAMALLAAIGI